MKLNEQPITNVDEVSTAPKDGYYKRNHRWLQNLIFALMAFTMPRLIDAVFFETSGPTPAVFELAIRVAMLLCNIAAIFGLVLSGMGAHACDTASARVYRYALPLLAFAGLASIAARHF